MTTRCGGLVRPRIVGLIAAIGVAGGCAAAPSSSIAEPIACAAGEVTGQGSSAQATAVITWIRNYQVACSGATIEYRAVGSGAGVTAFVDGHGDFAGSDSALTASARPPAERHCGGPVLHLPMVVGPIALAYNVAGVGDLRLRPATIARVFAGTITSWNDPAIAADNGESLPAKSPVPPTNAVTPAPDPMLEYETVAPAQLTW